MNLQLDANYSITFIENRREIALYSLDLKLYWLGVEALPIILIRL